MKYIYGTAAYFTLLFHIHSIAGSWLFFFCMSYEILIK